MEKQAKRMSFPFVSADGSARHSRAYCTTPLPQIKLIAAMPAISLMGREKSKRSVHITRMLARQLTRKSVFLNFFIFAHHFTFYHRKASRWQSCYTCNRGRPACCQSLHGLLNESSFVRFPVKDYYFNIQYHML